MSDHFFTRSTQEKKSSKNYLVLKTRRNIECANHHTKSNSKYSTYTGTMHDVFNVATPNCWQIKIIIRYRLTTYSNIFIFSRVFVSENTTNNFLILRLKIIVFFLKDFFFRIYKTSTICTRVATWFLSSCCA